MKGKSFTVLDCSAGQCGSFAIKLFHNPPQGGDIFALGSGNTGWIYPNYNNSYTGTTTTYSNTFKRVRVSTLNFIRTGLARIKYIELA